MTQYQRYQSISHLMTVPLIAITKTLYDTELAVQIVKQLYDVPVPVITVSHCRIQYNSTLLFIRRSWLK